MRSSSSPTTTLILAPSRSARRTASTTAPRSTGISTSAIAPASCSNMVAIVHVFVCVRLPVSASSPDHPRIVHVFVVRAGVPGSPGTRSASLGRGGRGGGRRHRPFVLITPGSTPRSGRQLDRDVEAVPGPLLDDERHALDAAL